MEYASRLRAAVVGGFTASKVSMVSPPGWVGVLAARECARLMDVEGAKLVGEERGMLLTFHLAAHSCQFPSATSVPDEQLLGELPGVALRVV